MHIKRCLDQVQVSMPAWFRVGGPKKHDSVEAKQRNMLWMEEILHQLVDGLSAIPFNLQCFIVPNSYPAWCRISQPSTVSQVTVQMILILTNPPEMGPENEKSHATLTGAKRREWIGMGVAGIIFDS